MSNDFRAPALPLEARVEALLDALSLDEKLSLCAGRSFWETKPVPRLGSEYWNAQWDEIDLPLAKRSTFGWTQLPAVRDLQPDEPVGGNIVLPRTTGTFDIEAQFYVGQDKRGGMLVTRFENIQCPRDVPGP